MMWFSERELGHAMLDVARFGRPLSGDSQTKFFLKEMKQQILFRRHFGVDVPGKPTGNSRVLVFPLVTSLNYGEPPGPPSFSVGRLDVPNNQQTVEAKRLPPQKCPSSRAARSRQWLPGHSQRV